MKQYKLGCDLVEVERFQRVVDRYGDLFLDRVFTPEERAYCEQRKAAFRVQSYAARWAAKEAIAKALGTGIGGKKGPDWREIAVRANEAGEPTVFFSGKAIELVKAIKLEDVTLSMSHERKMALATCLLVCKASDDEGEGAERQADGGEKESQLP